MHFQTLIPARLFYPSPDGKIDRHGRPHNFPQNLLLPKEKPQYDRQLLSDNQVAEWKALKVPISVISGINHFHTQLPGNINLSFKIVFLRTVLYNYIFIFHHPDSYECLRPPFFLADYYPLNNFEDQKGKHFLMHWDQ